MSVSSPTVFVYLPKFSGHIATSSFRGLVIISSEHSESKFETQRLLLDRPRFKQCSFQFLTEPVIGRDNRVGQKHNREAPGRFL